MRLASKFGMFVFAWMIFATTARAEVDRVTYAKSIYQSLEKILPILIESAQKTASEKENAETANADPRYRKRLAGDISVEAGALAYLIHCVRILGENRPPLVFVDDPGQFVMSAGEKPVLMRAPDEASSPIYINKQLLNSDDLALNLVQIMKLYLHELGHKTGSSSIALRDEWAQHAEDKLDLFYRSSGTRVEAAKGEDGIAFIEFLSLPAPLIQSAVTADPYDVQPTQWVYVEKDSRVYDVSPELRFAVRENAVLTRTIGTEIIGVLMELANVFGELVRTHMGPIVTGMQRMFEKPNSKVEKGIFADLPTNVSSMTLLELQQVSQSPTEIILEATQGYTRSHMRKMHFNVSDFPWEENGEFFQVQIKIDKRSLATDPQISLQFSPVANYDQIARVGRISRDQGVLHTLEVTFEHEGFPFMVDLGLHFPGGTLRLPASDRRLKSGNTYIATFILDSPEARRGFYADRVTIDNEEVIFLDRRIEVQPETQEPSHFEKDDFLADSFGVWGVKNSEHVLKKNFSSLVSPYQSMIDFGGPQFVINPYNLWIQFEVREEVEIYQAELLWMVEHTIVKTEVGAITFPMREKDEDGIEREHRYAESGQLVERRSQREMVLFTADNASVEPGTKPGYKTIMMRSMTPMKRLRDNLGPLEAHTFPRATPLGVRILDSELRSFSHNFAADPEFSLANRKRITCEDLLSQIRRTPSRQAD